MRFLTLYSGSGGNAAYIKSGDTEILIEVTPAFVEIWDTTEENYAFQIFIDFRTQSVEVKQYDQF